MTSCLQSLSMRVRSINSNRCTLRTRVEHKLDILRAFKTTKRGRESFLAWSKPLVTILSPMVDYQPRNLFTLHPSAYATKYHVRELMILNYTVIHALPLDWASTGKWAWVGFDECANENEGRRWCINILFPSRVNLTISSQIHSMTLAELVPWYLMVRHMECNVNLDSYLRVKREN